MAESTPMKLVHALWGDSGRPGPDLLGRLSAAGVTRVQVNLDDEGVADAQLRLSAFEMAPQAVFSTWGGEVAAVLDALVTPGGRIASWLVEETRQLEAPATQPGERGPFLAQVAFLRRPDELDQAEWLKRWQLQHTPVAIATQHTLGYVQDVVLDQVAGEPLEVHGIVEELFVPEASTDIHAFYGSAGNDAELTRRMTELMASVQRMGADRDITVVPTSRYVFPL